MSINILTNESIPANKQINIEKCMCQYTQRKIYSN